MAMRRLSSTVRLGNSRRPSGTSDTPLRLVSYGRPLAISAPAKAMLPALQRTVPVIALSVVVLPTPLRPSRATASPSCTTSDRSSSTTLPA